MRHRRLLLALILFALPAVAAGQSVVLSVRAVLDSLDSGPHLFGFHDDALAGIDDYDVPEPPHAPADYLSLAFTMLDPDVPLPNRWRDELRNSAIFEDQGETWRLLVETDHSGTLRLYFDVLVGQQYPLSLEVSDAIGDRADLLLDVPSVVPWPVTGSRMELDLTLTSSVAIPTDEATWSRLKALYGR